MTLSSRMPESLLIDGLRELSLPFSPAQIGAFMTYLSELKKWNKAYNLTALKTDEDIIVKHFFDSLLYLNALPGGVLSVMDVGSGAGFPGIPLKIVRPGIMVHLLEPSRKKANFLRHISRTLALDAIEVMETRIEEVRSLTVDVAVTRALFGIREFIKKVAPHVKEGGMLIASKGPKIKEELEWVKEMGFEVMTLFLPTTHIRRFVVRMKKGSSVERPEEHAHESRGHHGLTSSLICANAECRLRKAGC
ncbi:MAG TPA: 16S rRNA (guanine(527)-N(7))-methyltransferase RsmG, partial [Thermodesulfovibrionales bacterium]|nr:16S rRNA (guanine(527)-N(7))-methyltransferase RsmG [Thermodesulfovibrionales bacterium]